VVNEDAKAKYVFDGDGNLSIVKWKVCTKIKREHKLLVPKWDSLNKHVRKRKNEKGVRVMDFKCAHAKNETCGNESSICFVVGLRWERSKQ
jgi:hypothetical protein